MGKDFRKMLCILYFKESLVTRTGYIGDTVSPNNELFGDTVSPNNELFGDTVSPNNFFLYLNR